ncbi:hypothetical protein M440DRAFT_1122155 [Trichoderma longibrachiatum ATCC 18648]|uniref:Uncharacterized protein n=1 Tax=Trichoderma longibrachiatum ATCC 18648 TaxID=983965 RepID=A0A2T4CFH2_TRILO|nr:hypothetical protein M440DRAFT_1122155 [Trichoderma longibrachiatum ATCC 18648]
MARSPQPTYAFPALFLQNWMTRQLTAQGSSPETCAHHPSTRIADMSKTAASTEWLFPAMSICYLAGVSGAGERIIMPPCARILHAALWPWAKSAAHVTLGRDSLWGATVRHANTLVVCFILCRPDWLRLTKDAGAMDPNQSSEVGGYIVGVMSVDIRSALLWVPSI